MKKSLNKFLQIIKKIVDQKYFARVILIIIVLLQILLLWLNRFSYTKGGWETEINNFTGIGCERFNVYKPCK